MSTLALGNKERFEMSENFFGITKGQMILATSEKSDDLLGIPCYVNRNMPKDMAVLIDSNGEIVQIFKMEPVK